MNESTIQSIDRISDTTEDIKNLLNEDLRELLKEIRDLLKEIKQSNKVNEPSTSGPGITTPPLPLPSYFPTPAAPAYPPWHTWLSDGPNSISDVMSRAAQTSNLDNKSIDSK